MTILYVLAYILGACYIVFIAGSFKDLITRVKDQFADAELYWGFGFGSTYGWLFAGLIHSIAEVIVFLILAVPATIHCIILLPSIFSEDRVK